MYPRQLIVYLICNYIKRWSWDEDWYDWYVVRPLYSFDHWTKFNFLTCPHTDESILQQVTSITAINLLIFTNSYLAIHFNSRRLEFTLQKRCCLIFWVNFPTTLYITFTTYTLYFVSTELSAAVNGLFRFSTTLYFFHPSFIYNLIIYNDGNLMAMYHNKIIL